MARRRRKKSRRSGSRKLPLAVVVPMAVSGYYNVAKPIMAGNHEGGLANLTGYDTRTGKFEPQRYVYTYGPILAGVVIHKIAGRVGANRYIPKWLPVSI